MRKQSAKAGRIQQAIDDIAGAAPRSRGGSRSLCDRCEGALLVVAQLAHIGASWRGASGPDVQLDGGLAMTMQLLRTRHERLQDAAKEEDARLSAHEKLTNQLANGMLATALCVDHRVHSRASMRNASLAILYAQALAPFLIMRMFRCRCPGSGGWAAHS